MIKTDLHAKVSGQGNAKNFPSTGVEDISIVMPVYNHEASLTEALDSALMQEMPYSSVIYCFNDASTDKSAAILAEYEKKYPDKIRVYTNPKNLGCGKASYLFHRPPIKGRYWCILAGDDYWLTRDKLAKQIAYLDGHPDYVGCSCDSEVLNEMSGERSIIKPDRNSWNLLDLVLLNQRYAFYVHTTSLVWRNIFLEKGFFLPPVYQKKEAFGDVVLMHAMLGKGGKVRNLPEMMSCYRVTGRGIWTSKSEQERAKMNDDLPKILRWIMPLRYKVFIYLQGLRQDSRIAHRLIPGPVNE